MSELRKRFGAGGRHCANYLTKVGVFKREEQTDPIFSLSSTIYRDVEEVKLRISAWRAEEREAATKPRPKTMLDTITSGILCTLKSYTSSLFIAKGCEGKYAFDKVKLSAYTLLDALKKWEAAHA